ncbi:MAG: GNAT family N-acetyltransferase [Anaerolineaceae bacterium]|jgi:GNAT superfamily N-acetyltransferase|nr:GNAT family N-acetyltransferase [Anaerolineaceae bacterium]
MTLQIKEVLDLKDLNAFIDFPHHLYKDSPYWVPNLVMDDTNALRRDKNSAFAHCEARYWLAYDDSKIVGRIAGILNHAHHERWDEHYVRFGWFDFVDDLAVSSALLQKVEGWALEKGMTAVHGPLGFTDLDREGMLIEGFDELGTLATIYNYPYYPQHMERLGYVKDTDWVEYEIQMPDEVNEKIAKAARIALKRNNLHLLEARSKRHLLTYGDRLFDLLNEAYQDLYGVVALNPGQKESYTKQYFSFIHPDFVPIVLDEDDNMVAFGITMPSLSVALQRARGRLFPFGFVHLLRAMRKFDRADLYLIAVKRSYQGKAVTAILMNRMLEVFEKHGVRSVESNPELEDNQQVRALWKFFDKRQHKRRRCFIKHLDEQEHNAS